MKQILAAFFVAIVLPFVAPSSVQAAASLSLSGGSGNIAQGQKFTVAVNVNTGGEAVNAVEVVINFPADKLTASYISDSGSSFDIKAESTLGAGVVKIARGKLPPAVAGFRRVATVGFVAKSQGDAALTISSESKVLRESDSANIFSGSASAKFNIGAPVAYATPSSEAEKQVGQAVADTTAPKIDGIAVLNLGIQTATIFWRTDEAGDSQVEYGFVTDRVNEEVNYFFNAQNADLVTEHTIQLDAKTLKPGNLYHFKVKSKDAAGNLADSQDSTFIAPGYPLLVTVLDRARKPVSLAQVVVKNVGVESTTDKSGQARFEDMPVGIAIIAVEYKEKVKETSATVNADDNELTIILDQKVSNFNFGLMILPILLLSLIACGLFVRFYIRKRGRGGSDSSSSTPITLIKAPPRTQ